MGGRAGGGDAAVTAGGVRSGTSYTGRGHIGDILSCEAASQVTRMEEGKGHAEARVTGRSGAWREPVGGAPSLGVGLRPPFLSARPFPVRFGEKSQRSEDILRRQAAVHVLRGGGGHAGVFREAPAGGALQPGRRIGWSPLRPASLETPRGACQLHPE